MSSREETTIRNLSQLVRISGYLIAGGAFAGFIAGLLSMFNHDLFIFITRISQFEAMGYFFGVFAPSFAILIIIGYLFVTAFGPKKTNLSNLLPFCALSLLAIALSGISVFFTISLVGGFLTLEALVRTYTKPTFKALARKEAFFLTEIGAMLIASFSTLSLLLWLISSFFSTYALGFYKSYSPFALLLAGILSFLMFISVPTWGSQGRNAGISGLVGLTISTLSYLLIVRNQYALFDPPAYVSMFVLALGVASSMAGNLIYVDIFLSAPPEPEMPKAPDNSELLWEGKYCPYCGSPRLTLFESLCSRCGRGLMWTPYAPFCTTCGRLVPSDAQTCPHCHENILNKEMYFLKMTSDEKAIADKLIARTSTRKALISSRVQRIHKRLKHIFRAS